MARGEVRWRFVLDTRAFTDGMKAAKQEANALAGELSSRLGPAGNVLSAMGSKGLLAAAGIGAVTAAAVAAGKATLEAVSAAMKYADNLAALQEKTGLTSKALQDMEVAAKLGNTSLEAIAGAVNKMQVALVNGSDDFRKLGLSIKELKGMSPEEQFKKVSTAILSLGTAAERTAASQAVMGKSATELLGAMKAAASGASDLGGALSEDALEASADLADQADLLSTAWDRVVLQFGAAVAQSPELKRALVDLTDLLVKMAQTVEILAPKIAVLFDKFVIGARKAAEIGEKLAQLNPISFLSGLASKGAAEQLALDLLFADVQGGGSSSAIKPKKGGLTFGGGKAPKGPDKLQLGGFRSEFFNATAPMFSGGKVDILPRGNFGMAGFDLLNGKPATEMAGAAKATIDWRNALMDVSNAFGMLQGKAAQSLGAIAGGIATIGQLQKQLSTSVDAGGLKGAGGLGGLLGKVGAGLGIAGAAFSIGGAIFGGIKSLFGGKSKEEKAAEQAAQQQKVKETISSLESLMEKAKKLKMDQLTGGVSGLAAVFGHLATKTDETGERFRRLEFFGAALFKSLKEEGLSSAEAFKVMGPALDQAIAAAKANGQELTGLLGSLASFRELVQANEGLVGAVSGFNDLVTAVGVTRETFQHIQPEMQAFFDEMIAKGFTADQAVGELAPTLMAIRDAAREGRIQIDAGTQALIDQAEAGGHFDGLKDPMQELVEIQKAMLELWAAIAHMQGVTLPASLQEYINSLHQAQGAAAGVGVGNGGVHGGASSGIEFNFPEGAGEEGHAASGLHTILGRGPLRGGGTPLVGHPGEEAYIGRPRGGGGMIPPIQLVVDGKVWARHNNQNIRRNRHGTASEARRFG